jgi:hypothetical protein
MELQYGPQREEPEMATWADPIPQDDQCPVCDGNGRKNGKTCLLCNGTGLRHGG